MQLNQKYGKVVLIFTFLLASLGYAQNDETELYKKRVLETAEIDFLYSFYTQDGDNAAVTGGIGTESLTDQTPTIVVSIPLNDDDVLTIDAGISAYTSASSSNLDPFEISDDDDDDDEENRARQPNPSASPWVESSGASKQDVWYNINASYSHASDDRNKLWSANINFATEYDYTSFGFGGSYAKLFNEKNTEVSIKSNVFFDFWSPEYPVEFFATIEKGQSLSNGLFAEIDVLDQNGNTIDKNGANAWSPLKNKLLNNKNRNSYSVSLSFSQILSENAQLSLFADLAYQNGWLANPMQRVYFADRPNFYVGNPSGIANYASPSSRNIFQLADDIERLPDTRFKIPIGGRLNYFINELFVLRTYYRFYFDDWGIQSHTANLEIPIKIKDKFTLYPSYRYYNQTVADHFAPYEQHISTQEFYTSDYDLSEFTANQFSFSIKYTDIFTSFHIGKLGLKNVNLKFSRYERDSGLTANILSFGTTFIFDRYVQ